MRCLEIHKLNKFAFSYIDIVKYSKGLPNFSSEDTIVIQSLSLRNNTSELDIGTIYDTLTLLSNIEDELMKEFEEKGNICYCLQ